MNLLFFLFIIIAVVPLAASQSSAASRASFGEACDEIRCDSRSSLTCNNGTCQCIKPDEMTYDKTKRKCVVISGERCSYTAIEILTDTTQEKRWTERLDCVENAVCNNDGFCDCRSEFFEGSNGLCNPKRLHNENCTKHEECRVDKNLVCDGGRCSCNKTEAVFDPAYSKCVARAGITCTSKYDQCVRNAQCSSYYYDSYNRYRSGGTGKCSCSSDYKSSKSGLCLAKYGMACDISSAPCTEEFSCVNRKCVCHFPHHQYYNSTLTECVSTVHGPCSETVEGTAQSFQCVKDAECRKVHGVHKCLCKEGYIESDGRKCRVAHGQPCSEIEACDTVAKLQCKNGKCSCQDFESYDTEMSMCRGLIGAKCFLNSTDFCVDGATCKAFRDKTSGEGVCSCVSPSSVDSTRRTCDVLVLLPLEFLGFNTQVVEDVINGTADSDELFLADDETTTMESTS